MITSIRTELLKLATIRLPLGLLATGGGLTATMAMLTAARAGGPGSMAADPLNTAAGLTAVLATTYFAMLMAMVLGVTVATGEFRHQTATATYLAIPNRVRVLGAKAIAASGFGLGFGLGSLLRAQLGAVITVFVWGLLGETIVGGLSTPVPPTSPLPPRPPWQGRHPQAARRSRLQLQQR
jgi:ABC-2 type transport system permease protein